MPLEIRKGNLFEFDGSLAHGVNAAGAMGKGIAVDFKEKWPKMYAEYKSLCDSRQLFPGQIHAFEYLHEDQESIAKWSQRLHDQLMQNLVVRHPQTMFDAMQTTTSEESLKKVFGITQASLDTKEINGFFDHRYIYNLCIKAHWKLPSETYMVWAALRNMVEHMEKHDIKAVAMPAIGCGLGGLDWETQVKPIVEEVASQTPCLLVVYLP